LKLIDKNKMSEEKKQIEIPEVQKSFYYEAPVDVGSAPAFGEANPVPTVEGGKANVPEGFVLVRVCAASLNPVDKYIAAGYMEKMSPEGLLGMNRSMGSDLAGEVVAVGASATLTSLDENGAAVSRPVVVGDIVFADGIQGTGTFAQYAMVKSSQLSLKPDNLSFVEAAAIPLGGLTALQCFTTQMSKYGSAIGKDSKVLVLGGSGGVGSLAVQIAKALGATVAATSSDVELLKKLGADVAINYHDTDWGEELKGENYDLIFATVDDAKPTPAASRAAGVLGPKGVYLCLLEQSLPDPVPDNGQTYATFFTDSTDASGLATLAGFIKADKLKPVLHGGKSFPFSEEGLASLMAVSNSGRAKGKLVLEVSSK
jgi:NADPH:quinone reductase-like Zn-dependent oxidoreductase